MRCRGRGKWARHLGPLLLLVSGIVAGPARPAGERSLEVDGIAYSHPSSIRFSPQEGLFYIADTGNRRVVLLGDDLRPVGSLFLGPLGIAPYCALPVGDGTFWVSDLNRPDLDLIGARGDRIATLALAPDAAPGRMAWGPKGRLYVIERVTRSIWSIDPAAGGASAETLRVPTDGKLEDLTFLSDGSLVVVAATGTPFWIRRARGGAWESWGSHGSRPEDSSFPSGVSAGKGGGFWVVDAFRHELRRFGADLRLAERIGQDGFGELPILFPVGVAVDARGDPLVLERGGCRVQRLARSP